MKWPRVFNLTFFFFFWPTDSHFFAHRYLLYCAMAFQMAQFLFSMVALLYARWEIYIPFVDYLADWHWLPLALICFDGQGQLQESPAHSLGWAAAIPFNGPRQLDKWLIRVINTLTWTWLSIFGPGSIAGLICQQCPKEQTRVIKTGCLLSAQNWPTCNQQP